MTGIKVMINALSGDDEWKALRESVGKTISKIEISDSSLNIWFSDGKSVCVWDDGQSCCEYRHMTCDDDLSYHFGATLLDAEIKSAPSIEARYDTHEIEFFELKTSRGVISVANHNEHNGYYGGFSLRSA